MKKKIFISYYVLSNVVLCFSQKEATQWHFGLNAGLDFSTGTPTIITTSALNTQEGSASIADGNGNLLFYTNGMNVYDRTNAIMPNGTGLFGHQSTSQSALIIKRPGSNSIYYIFQSEAQGGLNGYTYSTVDMTLNGGLGDVTIKNTPLYGLAAEKLTGTLHCNGTDVWVITHEYAGNGFRAYLVTAAGVSAAPVISNVGTVFNNSGGAFDAAGQMKCSPDGTKIAMGMQNNGIELFDFNRTTGTVSNPLKLSTTTIYSYGIEFSPDNTKLYGCGVGPGTPLKQWDICAGNSAAILASETNIFSVAGVIGSMQLGPDGKIYVARQTLQSCGVINNPNAAGLACNYVDNGQSVAPGTNVWGLPNFVTSQLRPKLQFASTFNCLVGSFTAPTISTCPNPQTTLNSVSWNFGDPSSGANNTSSLNNPSHTFTSAGNYTVTLILNYVCGSDTIQQTVTAGVGGANNVQNISICSGNSYTLPGGGTANSTGTYIDTLLSFNGCDSIITTNLTVTNYLTSSQNPTICSGSSFTLPDGNTVNSAGTYIDTIPSLGGCDSIITTNLTVNPPINISVNTSICSGNTYTLPGGNIVSSSGTYTDTIQTIGACDTIITTTLTVNPPATFSQNPTICSGSNFTLPSGNIVNTSGIYIDTIQTSNGCDSIITTGLTVTNMVLGSQSPNLCQGNNFILPNGNIVSAAGIYIDTILSSSGCDSVVTTNLTYKPSSIKNIYDTICDGNFHILPKGDTASVSGVYKDTLTASNGCDSIITTNLTVHPNPIIVTPYIQNQFIYPGQSTLIVVGGGTTYTWWSIPGLNTYTGDSVYASPTQNTTYVVTIKNIFGCIGTTYIPIKVKVCTQNGNLETPNAFSPNNDGVNDEYCLQGWDKCIESFSIFIYNRWGEKVFESKDPNFCWDGKLKGNQLDAQVFIFYIKAKFLDIEKVIIKKGNITMIK